VTLQARSALGHEFGRRIPLGPLGIPDVTVCERTDFGCLMLSSCVDDSAVIGRLEASVGCSLPRASGAVVVEGAYTGIWLTPRSWLLLCPLEQEFALVDGVGLAFPERMAHASPFTDFLCWFSLGGDNAENLLKQGGFISLAKGGLPVGHTRRTRIASIPIIVSREKSDDWLVAVERSRARYFHNWMQNLVTT